MAIYMSNAALREALRLIDENRSEGAEMVGKIAASGDAEALYVFGGLVWSGTLVPQDPVRARLLFEYAAAQGHNDANLLVTNLLASGVAGKRDWQAALGRLQAEARVIASRRTTLDIVHAMSLDGNGNPVTSPTRRSLSDAPLAFIFEGLLTAAECSYLIDLARDQFAPSMVHDENGELMRDTIRTSDGATLHYAIEDPAVHAVNRRIAAATHTPYENGEALQVLRYVPGQEYHPHFDWVGGASSQRLWTALVYLNEEYQGGETEFVRTGLKFKGRAGDMMAFSNADRNGDGDPLAEHAGLPVTSGTKYLATRWIREARWIP